MTPSRKTRPFTSRPASNGSHSAPTGAFEIRPAVPDDLAFCYRITTELADHYLDDFEQLDLPWIKQLISSGQLYCIDYGAPQTEAIPVGLIWHANIRLPVSVELHFLLWPRYFKKAHRQDLFCRVIQFTFNHYPIRKIKANCKHTQSVAIQLLKRLHFETTGYSRNDTLINGYWVDSIRLELTRYRWDIETRNFSQTHDATGRH